MDQLQEGLIMAFSYDFRQKFKNAMAKGLVGATREIEGFARQLGMEQFGNAADAKAQFEPIAEEMRAALLTAYERTVEATRLVPSYERNNRLAGALRKALEDPSMATADGHGISYINRTLLDKEAKHWRRLNYGAAGYRVGGSDNVRFPVRFDQRILFYAGSEGSVRPAFFLPPGRFVDPRTGNAVPFGLGAKTHALGAGNPNVSVDRFFPGGGGRYIHQTGGIQPRHFIDAGFKVLADNFGIALDQLYAKWSREAAKFPTPAVTVEA